MDLHDVDYVLSNGGMTLPIHGPAWRWLCAIQWWHDLASSWTCMTLTMCYPMVGWPCLFMDLHDVDYVLSNGGMTLPLHGPAWRWLCAIQWWYDITSSG